jgi:hypothetical protein
VGDINGYIKGESIKKYIYSKRDNKTKYREKGGK